MEMGIMVVLAALAALQPAPAPAAADCLATPSATVLTVQGDRLRINGQPQFLVIASYFDGIHRAPNRRLLIEDLCYFKRHGVHGLRVMPNWRQSNPASAALMRPDGTLDDAQLTNLQTLIDEAGKRGLVVDVTFYFDGGNRLGYRDGVRRAAQALQRKTNILFDLQNEFDATPCPPEYGAGCATAVDGESWGEFLATDVKSVAKPPGSTRIVTLSRGSDRDRQQLVDEVQRYQFDVLPVHYRFGAKPPFSGSAGWWQDTGPYAKDFKARFAAQGPVRPIYFQEPSRFNCGKSAGDEHPEHYKDAARDAKAAGAAAWTFHTCGTKDLSQPVSFERLLDPRERQILDYLGSAAFTNLQGSRRDLDLRNRVDLAVDPAEPVQQAVAGGSSAYNHRTSSTRRSWER